MRSDLERKLRVRVPAGGARVDPDHGLRRLGRIAERAPPPLVAHEQPCARNGGRQDHEEDERPVGIAPLDEGIQERHHGGGDEHGAGKAHQNERDAAYSRCGRPASSCSPCSDHETEAARTWKLLKVAEVPPWADETQGPARPA